MRPTSRPVTGSRSDSEAKERAVVNMIGVRLMGLVYSESNLLGSGLADIGDAGLTKFGHRVVQRMNKLGSTATEARNREPGRVRRERTRSR